MKAPASLVKLNTAVYLFSATVGLAQPTAAEIAATKMYRWSDVNGKLHLSDKKPPHKNYQTVDRRELPPVHITPPPEANAAPIRKVSVARVKRKKAARKKRLNCARYETKLAATQKRLRAGYKEPAGNNLRAKRREYRALLKNCRKNL